MLNHRSLVNRTRDQWNHAEARDSPAIYAGNKRKTDRKEGQNDRECTQNDKETQRVHTIRYSYKETKRWPYTDVKPPGREAKRPQRRTTAIKRLKTIQNYNKATLCWPEWDGKLSQWDTKPPQTDVNYQDGTLIYEETQNAYSDIDANRLPIDVHCVFIRPCYGPTTHFNKVLITETQTQETY